MQRRNFLQLSSLLGLGGLLRTEKTKAAEGGIADKFPSDRAYWVSLLQKISAPVLDNMSKGELRKNMKIEVSPSWDGRPKDVAYMEAFGRLIAGIAPFVALPEENSAEGQIRKKLKLQIQQSLAHAVNPSSPDYLYWGTPKSRQPLVDAAFIAQALLAAPEALWTPLDETTKQRVIHEFKTIRQIKPANNNWVLFAAMIESFLLSIGEPIDVLRMDTAVETIEKWYIGDGWYKDGEKFHFDHYNGFVIHPMLVEVLRVNVANGRMEKTRYDLAYKRMQRYASFQERFISPEGTFPVFGRSSTYRAGLFQPLTKLALEHALPKEVTPAQVRCGLTAVLKKIFVPTSFTEEGCLTLGFVGEKQAAIADSYSNTGSLYLTAYVFLPLGLPVSDPFWSDPFTEWTQRKAWGGKGFGKDYAVEY
ncbi:MAG TPA: DUF2264 domain-containing protein [Chitinophagaceae bacterium]|nr:DUF2264 domain-containing protein [Chitinophagaceae bacterium]